jgi:hypothetical protein
MRAFVWIILALLGFLSILMRISIFNLLLGLPLLLVGVGFVAHSFWDVVLSIVSPKFNRVHCIICEPEQFKNHKKVKEILNINHSKLDR